MDALSDPLKAPTSQRISMNIRRGRMGATPPPLPKSRFITVKATLTTKHYTILV